MSNFAKCDFCTKEIKWMTPFYTFDMSYRGHTDKITIDVCKSCYRHKKQIYGLIVHL